MRGDEVFERLHVHHATLVHPRSIWTLGVVATGKRDGHAKDGKGKETGTHRQELRGYWVQCRPN
jgi:hypothetical protein